MENLTLEQKVILQLAKRGYLTNAGDIQRALKEYDYANIMVSALGDPGLSDDIKEGITSGNIEIEGIGEICMHDALTKEEIQEVFDNDDEEKSSK